MSDVFLESVVLCIYTYCCNLLTLIFLQKAILPSACTIIMTTYIWKLTYRDGIKRKGDKIGMVSVVSSKMRMFCRAVRRQIVRHLTTDRCWRLLENYLSTDNTIEEYVQRTRMARNGVWGTNIEMLAFCNLAGVNIASYNNEDGTYHYYGPAVIDPEVFDHDDSRPTIHLAYTGGDHFNVIVTQLPNVWV